MGRRSDSAQISRDTRIFLGKLVKVADLDIGRGHNARPLGARAQEPPTAPNQPRRVKCIARNEKLHALTAAQVGSDDDPLGLAVGVQQ